MVNHRLSSYKKVENGDEILSNIDHCPLEIASYESSSLFSLSPALQNLKEVKVINCGQLQELQQVFNVVKETNGVDHAIAFPCLQDLRLVNLTNLSWFHSKNFLVALPFLEKLEVCNCPRFTNFTIQKYANEQVQLKILPLN
ncbi:hypothetical protein SCA6_018647 [Theobroma cacao]